jgi:hypothetical protein
MRKYFYVVVTYPKHHSEPVTIHCANVEQARILAWHHRSRSVTAPSIWARGNSQRGMGTASHRLTIY